VSFTPGPYQTEGPDPFGDYTITQAGGGLAIAAVISNMRMSEEVASNARMIAAAPDLLEAATYASQHLRQLIDGDTHIRCAGCREDIFQAVRRLSEAVEQAEGHEQ
jgi:hypothetical protein